MVTTKEEILEYICAETLNLKNETISHLIASKVSEELSISRSLASQYLNELHKEGYLIKISTRPVCFIHRRKYELANNVTLKSPTYFSIEDFLNQIAENTPHRSKFGQLIGYDGSFKSKVSQIISSLVYPPFGLPLLLYGESGTGKKTVCKLIFEYCKSNDIIKSKKMKIISCQSNEEFEARFMSLLVGDASEKGALDTSERDILFIYNAENLSTKNQNFLYEIIESNSYQRYGEKQRQQLKVQIILVVNGKYPGMFSNELIQVFPAICQIPSVVERPLQEKEEFIVYFLKHESLKLERRIFVSDMAMSALVNYDYKENVKGIRKVIQSLCAKENYGTLNEHDLFIKLFQLPEEVLAQFSKTEVSKASEVNYIDVENYVPVDETASMIQLFETIIASFGISKESYIIDEQFLNEVDNAIKNYTEHNSYHKLRGRQKEQILAHSIEEIVKGVLEQHGLTVAESILSLIARVIHINTQYDTSFGSWQEINKAALIDIYAVFEKDFNNECYIVERVEQVIFSSFELKLDLSSKVLLILVLSRNKELSLKRRYLSVIIAHGNTTASSIAEAINTMLNTYIFDSIDMPLETSMKEVSERLKKYISRSTVKSDVIILVDMGSLESIDRELVESGNRNIGIINSVSTQMALEIGYEILNNSDLESILARAQKKARCTYKLMKQDRLKDMIVFISDNGVYMANRFRTLFQKSLPKVADIELATLEYNNVLSKSYLMEIEKKYNVLFITGIFGPGIQGKEFIPIEDLINSITRIQSLMLNHLTAIEFEMFKNNLLRNFSLQNLVSNITILEPNILIDFVVDATNDLKRKLNLNLTSKTLVGLYIHISCLVERLVTKEPNESHLELGCFEDENKKLIQAVKESFSRLCTHYRVEIPISEIAYLYDYINNDNREEE